MNFPEMSRLLKQVETYRGKGIAAALFYEGKVAEAISLIVEWSRLQQQKKMSEKAICSRYSTVGKSHTVFKRSLYSGHSFGADCAYFLYERQKAPDFI